MGQRNLTLAAVIKEGYSDTSHPDWKQVSRMKEESEGRFHMQDHMSRNISMTLGEITEGRLDC